MQLNTTLFVDGKAVLASFNERAGFIIYTIDDIPARATAEGRSLFFIDKAREVFRKRLAQLQKGD